MFYLCKCFGFAARVSHRAFAEHDLLSLEEVPMRQRPKVAIAVADRSNRLGCRCSIAGTITGGMFLQIGAVEANCNLTSPASGQSVICDGNQPNPFTTPIAAQPGSSFVSINVQAPAILQTVTTAISVANNSFPTNHGRIVTSGPAAFGMAQVAGVGNGIGNFFTNAATGTIMTTGAGSHGINVVNPGAQTLTFGIINSGTIAVSGANANGINYTEQNARAAGAVLITNTATIASALGNGVLLFGGDPVGPPATRGGNLFNTGTITGRLTGVSVPFGDTTVTKQGGAVRRLSGNAVICAGDFPNAVDNIGGNFIGRADLGDDVLRWTGGTITGVVTLNTGNDTAILSNLTPANMAPVVDGGLGTDTLTLSNVVTPDGARFTQWESIALTNGTQLTLDSNLVLGDAGTLTGSLSIDATSTLFAGGGVNPVIQPFAAGQLATVTNAGLIDLTDGASGPTDRLTITGKDIGQGGRLALNTFLGNDASPSDRLLIDRGAASGSTAIRILNAGGPGDLTTANGILVVDTLNGGTTVPGTFVLAGPVVAGPYEYSLFRSSVDASKPQAWFLRSEFDCRLDPTAAVCRKPGPDPDIREEVSLYAAIPALALLYGRTLLDTLHERVGEEEHLRARSGASPHLTTTELGAGSSANTAIATVTVTAYSAPAPSSTSTFWRCRLVKTSTARKGRAAGARTRAPTGRSARRVATSPTLMAS